MMITSYYTLLWLVITSTIISLNTNDAYPSTGSNGLRCISYHRSTKVATSAIITQQMQLHESPLTIGDLPNLSSKEALMAVANVIKSNDIEKKSLAGFVDVSLAKCAPTINRFIIANPKAFLQFPQIAKLYFPSEDSMNQLSPSTPLRDLAKLLPVVYIADIHPDYGTLGFTLNNWNGKRMESMFPAFRSFRKSKVSQGGAQNKGSSFTMLHKRPSFPDNRNFRILPGKTDFKLYFSPDVAMANELCSTNDAKAAEFRFFEWATIWSPNQLEYEYEQRLWVTINGPPSIIFEGGDVDDSLLWTRVVNSLTL